jgi:NADPH-dependent curcumin reductase CurA
MSLINNFGRIVACGAISGYNSKRPQGISSYSNLIIKSASYEGFIVLNYAKRFPQAIGELA